MASGSAGAFNFSTAAAAATPKATTTAATTTTAASTPATSAAGYVLSKYLMRCIHFDGPPDYNLYGSIVHTYL